VLPADGVTDLMGNGIAETFTATFRTRSTPVGFAGNDEIQSVEHASTGTPSIFSVKDPLSSRLYEWDFGDGNSAAGASVSHTYAEPGRYSVTYHASNRSEGILEAEEAELVGGVNVATNHDNFSGSGFTDYPGAQGRDVKVSWQVELSQAATIDLVIQYALESDPPRPLNLYVNDGEATFVDLVVAGPEVATPPQTSRH
jgi:hypothetical protein